MKTVIQIENLSKRYYIGGADTQAMYRYSALRDVIVNSAKAPFRRIGQLLRGDLIKSTANLDEEIWALRDVSFSVSQGEVVGIIGRNGAGKSTLLKILSRITRPTKGQVTLDGRLGSLLEVGTGFHPELTGRENIYLNGAILGMKRSEIDSKFDEIVDFSGVEKFLDTPVKRYSSGMVVRLAFSVAAHLEPEILVIDEVLSVGDAAFQKKSMGKMGDVAGSGRTVLFVSHNMAAIESLCTRGIVLDQGQAIFDGNQTEAIQHYLKSLEADNGEASIANRKDRKGNGQLRFTEVLVKTEDGFPGGISGQAFSVTMKYKTLHNKPLHDATFALHITDYLGRRLITCFSDFSGDYFGEIQPQGTVICHLPVLPLSPGYYYLDLGCKVAKNVADDIPHAIGFHIAEGDFFGTGRLPDGRVHGMMLVKHHWNIEG
jgi:lipopolysaccharide transport system ATP-binding protein